MTDENNEVLIGSTEKKEKKIRISSTTYIQRGVYESVDSKYTMYNMIFKELFCGSNQK